MPSSQTWILGASAVSVAEAAALVRYAPWEFFTTSSVRTLSLYCILVNLVSLLFFNVFIYRLFLHPLRHLPGPKGSNIFIGEFLSEFTVDPPGEVFRRWINEIPNDGLLRYRTLLNATQLIATSHATLKSVMSDNTYDWQKPQELIDVLGRIIGIGIILSEGDAHRFQRKRQYIVVCAHGHWHQADCYLDLLPSFRMNNIKALYPLFYRKGCQMASTIKAEAGTKSADGAFEIEAGGFATRATLDIIGIAGFGHDFNSLKYPDDEIVQKYNWLVEPSKEKAAWFVSHVLFPGWLMALIPWKVSKRVNVLQKELHDYCKNLAVTRRAEFQKNPKEAESKEDILSHLVKSNDFSDEDLAHQSMTMLAAGHETTSSALTWVIYLLSKNKDFQTRLREEVRTALPSPEHDQAITAADIDRLPLLHAACFETLRLYPTVPVTGRLSIRDTFIKDVRVPKHTFIILSPWAINRSKEFWGEDAEEFVPDRWINPDGTSNKNGGATSNYSQITFLHGPRSCLGQDFSQSELKCLVAALVGKFEFELARPDADGQYTPAGVVTTKAAKGMYVRVKEIPGW